MFSITFRGKKSKMFIVAYMIMRLFFFLKWSHNAGWFSQSFYILSISRASINFALKGLYQTVLKLPGLPFLSDWQISRQIYSSSSWWDTLHPWPRVLQCVILSHSLGNCILSPHHLSKQPFTSVFIFLPKSHPSSFSSFLPKTS